MHKNKKSWFWLCLALLMVASCKDDSVKLPILKSDDVIVAFGDSLTEGYGSDPEHAYPKVLSKLMRKKVINAGVSGEETNSGVDRLGEVLSQYHPNMVILCEGGNDLLRNEDVEKLGLNLKKMIGMIRASGASVMMIGVPTPNLNPLGILKIDPIFLAVSDEMKVPLEGKIMIELEGDRKRKSDLIHPNSQGYADMAQAVYNFMVKHGAVLED